MAILGTLLKKGITLRESIEQYYTSPADLQKQELRNLLIRCTSTKFGSKYGFNKILPAFKSEDRDQYYGEFKNRVPIMDYERIYNEWWSFARKGEKNVCWPGQIKYFALSSGTSDSSSKYIPITNEMIKSIRKTSIRQVLTMSKYDLSASHFSKGILMLGGSTNLKKNGHYFEGDLSGITASQIPFWFQHFYKPGKKIAKTRDWNDKLNEIVYNAKNWDIGIIVGVPAWLQILLERIIEYYQVKSIHDIWKNLKVFVHGGVSFDPYKKGFERLLAQPLHYMETYLASEGFIAFQSYPQKKSMRLVLNNGIFYEFIPFDKNNFTDEGDLKSTIQTLKIDEIEENKDYALLMTTNAGAWRYLIGDVIRFVSLEETEITITGRTKHFMNLCGEHLSLENMNRVIEIVESELNIYIREFTLTGEHYENLFAHHWYIGSDDKIDLNILSDRIDYHLKILNDDYRIERSAALKKVFVNILPSYLFYQWMEKLGKIGSQNKFPRVLKNEKAELWKHFVTENM